MIQNYKIGILCELPFPVGMASTTRIISYSKGLILNGAVVEVFSFTSRNDDSPEPVEGNINDIKYIIPHRFHSNKGKFYHVFIDKPKLYKATINCIADSHGKQPFDYIFVTTDSIKHLRYFLPKLSRLKIPMAFINDEYPRAIRMLKKKVSLWDTIRYKYYHRFFKKRILMTKALENYYNREISWKPTFILCSVLDESRFEGLTKQPVERQYLCYMGNMQLKKDNVDNIIKAFSYIAKDFPEYDLYLYGTPNREDEAYVKNCIITTNMQERVFIKGRVDYYDVPQVLFNASVLVTSQPDTKRAEGGFPTKMGEYMMSRVPMLVTDVGEIRLYVKDGMNTFMVPPEDPKAYSEKLRFILTHSEDAKRVADNAYDYAISHFTAKEATKGLIPFLKS